MPKLFDRTQPLDMSSLSWVTGSKLPAFLGNSFILKFVQSALCTEATMTHLHAPFCSTINHKVKINSNAKKTYGPSVIKPYGLLMVAMLLSMAASNPSYATSQNTQSTLAIAASVNEFQARTYTSTKGQKLSYRLFIPKNYDKNKTYPLVLTLHGSGQRGTDNSGQLNVKFNNMWADDTIQQKHPSFVLAPQCPPNWRWVETDWGKGSFKLGDSAGQVPLSPPLHAVSEILDSLEKEFNLDKQRIYVNGLSMGGYGTWNMIQWFPTRFAAAIPVCGAGDPSKANRIKNISVWAFHGDKDGIVPVSGSRDMINALKTLGGTPKYSEIVNGDHGSWRDAESQAGLADWLFSNQLKITTLGFQSKQNRKLNQGLHINPLSHSGLTVFQIDGRKRLGYQQ